MCCPAAGSHPCSGSSRNPQCSHSCGCRDRRPGNTRPHLSQGERDQGTDREDELEGGREVSGLNHKPYLYVKIIKKANIYNCGPS